MSCARIDSGRWLVAAACIAALSFVGCKEKRERKSTGDQYVVVPDAKTPVLEGTQLKVCLHHGGWHDHFELRHRIEDGVAKIWLWKIESGLEAGGGGSSACDYVMVKVPLEVLLSKSIVLYAPDGRRYVLQ